MKFLPPAAFLHQQIQHTVVHSAGDKVVAVQRERVETETFALGEVKTGGIEQINAQAHVADFGDDLARHGAELSEHRRGIAVPELDLADPAVANLDLGATASLEESEGVALSIVDGAVLAEGNWAVRDESRVTECVRVDFVAKFLRDALEE